MVATELFHLAVVGGRENDWKRGGLSEVVVDVDVPDGQKQRSELCGLLEDKLHVLQRKEAELAASAQFVEADDGHANVLEGHVRLQVQYVICLFLPFAQVVFLVERHLT